MRCGVISSLQCDHDILSAWRHPQTETKARINTTAFGPRSDWSCLPLFTWDRISDVLFVSCYRSEQRCYRMAQGCLKCLKLTMCAANFLCFVRMSLSTSITLRSPYGITCYFYQPGGPSTVVRGSEQNSTQQFWFVFSQSPLVWSKKSSQFTEWDYKILRPHAFPVAACHAISPTKSQSWSELL